MQGNIIETENYITPDEIERLIEAKLYRELAAWAEDEFRSVNGQIEYLLTECVRQRRKRDTEQDD